MMATGGSARAGAATEAALDPHNAKCGQAALALDRMRAQPGESHRSAARGAGWELTIEQLVAYALGPAHP